MFYSLKKNIVICLFLLIPFVSMGQDAVFSQFYHNPLHTNPALTGTYTGKYRIGSTIRSQWYNIAPQSSFNTKSVFGDMRINIVGRDYLSVGFMIVDDHAGVAELGKANGLVSLSYSKHLSFDKYSKNNQYLVLGIQAGYSKSYYNNDEFLFGFQFDHIKEQVNSDQPSGEILLSSRLYSDINTGLMWYYSGRKNSFYLGASVMHLNRPNISLLESGSDKLSMRYSGIIGGNINFNEGFSILPAANLNFQGSHMQTIVGANVRFEYYSIDNNAFRIGAWARVVDSLDGIIVPDIIISTIIEFNKIELGISYDFSISELSYINNHRGAFEFSLIYIWGENPLRTPVHCPRF